MFLLSAFSSATASKPIFSVFMRTHVLEVKNNTNAHFLCRNLSANRLLFLFRSHWFLVWSLFFIYFAWKIIRFQLIKTNFGNDFVRLLYCLHSHKASSIDVFAAFDCVYWRNPNRLRCQSLVNQTKPNTFTWLMHAYGQNWMNFQNGISYDDYPLSTPEQQRQQQTHLHEPKCCTSIYIWQLT